MYRRPPQPTVTSDSGDDDSDEVIVDESNQDFFLPSSLSSFGLSAMSDDLDGSLSHHDPRHLPGASPLVPSMQRRGNFAVMNSPFGGAHDYRPLPAEWDDVDTESFPPPPPPLNIMDTVSQDYPHLVQGGMPDNPIPAMMPLAQGEYSFQPRGHLHEYPGAVTQSQRQGDPQLLNQYQHHQLPPPPPSPQQQYQPQQPQQQTPKGALADRTPLDVSKLSPWQRRRPHPQQDATNQQTTPFSALGLRWHKDTTYKSKSNTAPKEKENKKNSLERQTSPNTKKLSRQGSSSRTIGKPEFVRSVGEHLPLKPSQAEASSSVLASHRDPMLLVRDVTNATPGIGQLSPHQDQRQRVVTSQEYPPPEARGPYPLDPISPDILFSVDQGPFPFLKSRSTSSDESHSKRNGASRVKRKTKKKQKKKADSLVVGQGIHPQASPIPNRHSRNQSLPYPQHQYFHPSPRASPIPRLHRNSTDQQQQVTTQLLFDNPDVLSHDDDDNEVSNLNMMSFRRFSYEEGMVHSNNNPLGGNIQNVQQHQTFTENMQPNNANANSANPKQGLMASLSNIPPDVADPSGYNFNSKANQVTKRESLPKNLQDLDISIRDEFEQIKKEYQKKDTDTSLSVVNSNNVNRSKHSPKTSKKNSGYQSSGSSNGGGSLKKADKTSFRPSPSPSPGFLAFQNQHAQPTEDGKVSNTARAAPEVFKEYSLDLENRSHDKLDEEDDMVTRKRCKKHVCFLVVVMLVVVVAVAVAVLALTLGVDVTKEIIASKTRPKYAVVSGNLTLKIINRNFTADLLMPDSQAYRQLSDDYTRELDRLFLRSNLSQVYCGSAVLDLREGSIYTTSSITFMDEGLIASGKDVENVIISVNSLTNHSNEKDTIQLGEFIVCRSCVETHLEFLSIRRKPQVLLHTIAYPIDQDNVIVDSVVEKGTDNKEQEANNNSTEQSIIYKVPSTTTSQLSFTPTPALTSVKPLPPPSTSSTGVTVDTRPSLPEKSTSDAPLVHLPLSSTTLATQETTPATTSDTPTTHSTTRKLTTANNIPIILATTERSTPPPTTTDTPILTERVSESSTTAKTTIAPTVITDNPAKERTPSAPTLATLGRLSDSILAFKTTTKQPDTTTPPMKTTTTTREQPIWTEKSTTTDKPTIVDQTSPVAAVGKTSSDAPALPTEPVATTDGLQTETTVPDLASGIPKLDRVTLTPTVITVKDVSAPLTDDDVTVTCEIVNPHDWTAIVMIHTPVSQSESDTPRNTTLVTLEPTKPYATAIVYSNRVRPTYDMTESSVRLSATISDLGCFDYGIVECTLISRSGVRSSSRGQLTVTSPPAQPVLKAPLDAIENREVTPPILCSTQDVGYPHWTLLLQAVLLNSGTPITVPTEALKFQNGKSCSHGMTLVLKGYLPVLAANGTRLVCHFQAPNPIDLDTYPTQSSRPGASVEPLLAQEETSERDSLSDEQTLMVIRESICHNKGRRPSLIRHPYVCTRYIACEKKKATILSCPPNQCFDPVSGNCGVQAAFLEPIPGALHEGLSGLACSVIHVRDWTRMRIRRHSWGAFYDDIVEVNSEGHVTWHDDSLRSRSLTEFKVSTSPLYAELYMWIYDLECDDKGSYRCEVDREEEDSLSGGHLLKVYARASTPVLDIPTKVVEGQVRDPLEVECEATLGRPRGTLTLKRKLHHETEFQSVAFTTTTMQDEGSCLIRQKGVFEIPKEEVATYNASKWVCHVAPSAGTLSRLGRQVVSSEEQELSVVPDTVCGGKSQYLLAHPVYGCEHFLYCGDKARPTVRTCTPGNCFNAITHWCDIPAIGQHKQCEGNTGYLPHERLCNKFINCGDGEESVEQCPSGTVYATAGHCTADIHEAHCSNEIYGARSRS